MTPIPSPSANGRSSFYASRSMSEYCGCSVSTGAIDWMRRSCPVLKFETPMCRTRPCSLSSAKVAQPSSMSSSGIGQWIWYRSMASTPSPADARLGLAQDRIAL